MVHFLADPFPVLSKLLNKLDNGLVVFFGELSGIETVVVGSDTSVFFFSRKHIDFLLRNPGKPLGNLLPVEFEAQGKLFKQLIVFIVPLILDFLMAFISS